MKVLKNFIGLLWAGVLLFRGGSCLLACQDNAFARFFYAKELSSTLVSEELPSRILSVATSTDRQRVRFQFNTSGDKHYYFFSNEVFKDVFPLYSTGSYIIRKDEKGEIDQIKVFLLHREDSFIRLSKGKGQTLAFVQLLGKPIYSEIYLAKKLSYFALAPLSELKLHLGCYVDINFLFPTYQSTSNAVLSVFNRIREKINLICYVADGAMNDKGQFVHIADNSPQVPPYGFNCSGFAKWVADGFYKASTNDLISIERLKRRLLQTRGSISTLAHEYSRDPYFGLDWIRNIATVLESKDQEKSVSDQESTQCDVTSVPFLSLLKERGFSLDDLEFLLFFLTINNPSYFYFGSVNTLSGKDPVLLAQRHVTLLFPWLDEFGFFHVAVMDVNGEKDINYLKKKYPYGYIYLVRVWASDQFDLPALPIVKLKQDKDTTFELSN